MKTQIIAISKLKMNPKLLEMRHVNDVFVSRYRQAYRAGADMPKMIAEEKTLSIVSGNTRLTALRKEFPPNHKVEVILKRYTSKREMLEEFGRENLTHGNALDGISRKRLCAALIDEGASPEDICRLFNISIRGVERLGEGKVFVIGKKGKSEQFVKTGLEVQSGTLSAAEFEVHINRDRGISVVAMAQQLTRWLKAGNIKQTEDNLEALAELERSLSTFLKESKVRAS